jgi:hypothetical protein
LQDTQGAALVVVSKATQLDWLKYGRPLVFWDFRDFGLLSGFGGFGCTPAYLRVVLITFAKYWAHAEKVCMLACNK